MHYSIILLHDRYKIRRCLIGSTYMHTYMYIQPCLVVAMFSRNKTHPPNIVGNPRSVALILPTFSDNVLWVLTSNPRTFLKGFELKTKLSGLKMLETAGTRAKLCAFTYNCLLLWGKTSSSILFSTPALDGNHLQLS